MMSCTWVASPTGSPQPRCARSPSAVNVGMKTSWPCSRSSRATPDHSHAPPQAPWTITNVLNTSSLPLADWRVPRRRQRRKMRPSPADPVLDDARAGQLMPRRGRARRGTSRMVGGSDGDVEAREALAGSHYAAWPGVVALVDDDRAGAGLNLERHDRVRVSVARLVGREVEPNLVVRIGEPGRCPRRRLVVGAAERNRARIAVQMRTERAVRRHALDVQR